MKHAIAEFPKFVLGLFLGLFRATISEIEVFLIFILGVLVGFAVDPLWGGIVGLGFYLIFRMTSMYIGLFVSKIDQFILVMRKRNE